MKKIVITALLISSVFAGTYTTGGGIQVQTGEQQSDSHFKDVFENLDFGRFVESVQINWNDWGSCPGPLYEIPGFEVCYDEPFLIGDYSMQSGSIPSLGVTIDSNPAKAGYARYSDSEDTIHKFGYANIIYFPILGLILDENMFCFEKGDMGLPYLSLFDPTYDGVFSADLFRDIALLFNPTSILLGLVDCASASASMMIDGWDAARHKNDQLRMAFPHYFGCWNTFPMGGWSHNPDPIVQGATGVAYGLAVLTRMGLLKKTAKVPGIDGVIAPDTMCGPRTSEVFIKPQWLFNLAYPAPSSFVPLGAASTEWAEFKNKPGTIDSSSYWIAQRKCFLFGAADCSREGD